MLHQCVVFCNKLLQTIFTCTKLHSTNQSVEVGLTGEHMKTCDECETVKHCLEHGCVPKQPALVSKDEALKLALKALRFAGDDGYQNEVSQQAITAIKQALAQAVQEMTVVDPADWMPCTPEWINQGGDCAKSPRVWNAKECNHYHPATPPAQEFVCSTGLCHYKPAAPDLQAELDATNRQVEILSDALAESRREVAELKAVQEQIELAKQIWREDQQRIAELSAEIDRLTAAQPAPVPLTDAQINTIRFSISTKAVTQRDFELARAIEAAHGIGKGQP
jgi:hypothetical protein